MTDLDLIKRAHQLLLDCMKRNIDAEVCVMELCCLFEENGHPFIGSTAWPAND